MFVMRCRHPLEDLTCEISSITERLNTFCNHLQSLGCVQFNSLFSDLCPVLLVLVAVCRNRFS